jgi:hypothetical protein
MAKLKNIIKQLSERDLKAIYDLLIKSSADKSAYLLMAMRERNLSDTKIMEELEVNTNAYYTLRSRLNQKIEEYLLHQMESPRTDILKKVANINEIIFTKKKAIATATLKKLEKELLDYDLSNELTIVYKSLKKLHVNSQEFYTYSQLYNKHVAYMLAVDKAEDLLVDYFKKYGNYLLSGQEIDKMGLGLLVREMNNVSALYQSHRLYVYQSCMVIFHRLFVEGEESMEDDPIEDMLEKVDGIFNQYQLDSIYYHLKLLFEFLRLEYYNHYKVYRKAEKYYEEVNDAASNLLSNYSLYTFPGQFLLSKLERHIRMQTVEELYEENNAIFEDFEVDMQDIPKYTLYVLYRAISCYYAGRFEEAARWLNNLLNETSLKKYPSTQLELKTLLALQYCLMSDMDLFKQLINSIQRQMRLMDKDQCEHIMLYTKILKTSISEQKRNKKDKIWLLVSKLDRLQVKGFCPTRLIRIDDEFMDMLVKSTSVSD